MKHALILFFFLLFKNFTGQINFSSTQVNLGEIKEAYEIKTDVVIQNNGIKKLYLLKADCDKGVKVFTSKKSIEINDTALLIISFIPESSGKFNKEIKLFSSAQNNASLLNIKGDLTTLKKDDKTACYYFGKPNKTTTVKEGPIIVNATNVKRDNSNKIPDQASEPIVTKTITPEPEKPVVIDEGALPVNSFKPNNLLFLVDVSNSMKDSLKLPLLKIALHKLINDVREIDFITIVSYADSIKIHSENINGMEKEKLHAIVDKLKARGLTKGRQAILKSEDILIRHYIKEGNNQLILATDGKFNFYSEDEKTFIAKQQNTPVVMSVIGFGDDKAAIKNLKEIAEKGNGSFIHIKKKTNCESLLMDEIKQRSKKSY